MPAITIEPRPRQWPSLSLSPEQQAAAAASAAAFHAEREERRAVERPLREAMVAAQAQHGIVLRDARAALDCRCGCHPRLDLGAHGGAGQVGCSCQLTPEEREAAVHQLFASLAEARPQLAALRTRSRRRWPPGPQSCGSRPGSRSTRRRS